MTSRRVMFVGLETGGSLIHRVFRAWMDVLGVEASLEGLDLPPGTPPAAADNEIELAQLAAGALVINATGLGKDAPGCPVGPGARFPERAVVWDLNYRGELAFLRLARAQQDERGLRVHDGWTYFLHGWTQALAPLLDVRLDAVLFDRLAAVAAGLRQEA
jgi:shikimate 5-dehydrogenase